MPAKQQTVYRPRNPLSSPFHRLVTRHFEEFERIYSERFQNDYGLWTDPPPRSPPQVPLREITREPFYDDWVTDKVEA